MSARITLVLFDMDDVLCDDDRPAMLDLVALRHQGGLGLEV